MDSGLFFFTVCAGKRCFYGQCIVYHIIELIYGLGNDGRKIELLSAKTSLGGASDRHLFA